MPEPHAIAVLLVTVTVFFLYTRSWIRMELVSLLLLLALLLIFYIVPYDTERARITDVDVLHTFGHPALVAICSLMVLGRGLTVTGALEPAVHLLARLWIWNRHLGMLLTLIAAVIASGFINDTPVLVMLLPMLMGLATRVGYPASKMLMPVNFAVLAGGMLTSIGTSTNLLVLSIAVDLGMRPMGLLDFTPIASLSVLVALPYLWLLAPYLLPDTSGARSEAERLFDASITVQENGLVGKSLDKLRRMLGRPMPITGFIRAGRRGSPPALDEVRVGDVLLLSDTPAGLREVASVLGVDLHDRAGHGRFADAESTSEDVTLAEVVVGNNSDLVNRTIRDVRFADTHHVVVIGLSRGTSGLLRGTPNLSDTPLLVGDVLLVQGSEPSVAQLRSVPGLLLVDGGMRLPRSTHVPWALGIMAAVVLAAATHALPIHVAAFVGVVAMLVTGCVRLNGLGSAISLEVVLLVASSLALGQSFVSTGAADWVARGLSVLVELAPPAGQLAIFMVFAALLTNFVSNSAAAAVGTPIAMATAARLGSPVEPFVLAILFGANLSYATPMAYQTNVLVMNAAGYRFKDFLRVGVPLVILMLITLSVLLVSRYGL